MKSGLGLFVSLGLMLGAVASASAQQELLDDPEIYEKSYFSNQCQSVQYGPDFISRIDVNNDKLVDVVTNHGEIICDGVRGPGCTGDGCPYNFYLQVKEGGYFMIATAQMYGYDFIQRFGNMVFVLKMHPRYCERTDSRPCEMTVRVRGTRFMTISRK
ncbi:hypothetical protein FE840_005220 [Peteryoungia desertarenae]|uniref:Uncharacterized protein n=1 Tax=Peteryoungia desertarenae TaxID=1813451 RepID=A0ABX6QKA3_9HYPH|nr:hypothetical protein [Peteryoungia desertarenae]QLF68989.1 hypothetical protein FE840_005220 [Peteryoungia desertarenae]